MPMQGLSAVANPGPGVATGGDATSQLLGDPKTMAAMLAASGIAPPTGVQAPGAVPGMQYSGGVGGGGGIAAHPLTGNQLGLGQLLGTVANEAPPRTLGSLLRGA